MTLAEKYRPKRFEDVVGQDKACKILGRLDPGGRAFYLTGKSGTGKTTLALILARSVTEHEDWITEIDGQDLKIDTLNAWYRRASAPAMFGGFALIVNESHQLRAPVITRFLQILENLPSHAIVVFTTTLQGSSLFDDSKIDAGPFASRCKCIALEQRGMNKAAAERVKWIMQTEGMDGQPDKKYMELANECSGNIRRMLEEAESRVLSGLWA